MCSQLVDTHAKWVINKEIAGEDINEHEKFAPEIFEVMMNNLKEEQNKVKIEESIATCSEQEVVEILKDCDFDLVPRNNSLKSDCCIFDQNSQTRSEDIEIETQNKEFNEEVEIPEKVKKLYVELLESKRKHESILKFVVATEKVVNSDIVK